MFKIFGKCLVAVVAAYSVTSINQLARADDHQASILFCQISSTAQELKAERLTIDGVLVDLFQGESPNVEFDKISWTQDGAVTLTGSSFSNVRLGTGTFPTGTSQCTSYSFTLNPNLNVEVKQPGPKVIPLCSVVDGFKCEVAPLWQGTITFSGDSLGDRSMTYVDHYLN
jgi:hypothetical protein